MISQDRMEKALTYLAETDEPYARARALVNGLERQKSVIKAEATRRIKDGTQGAKEAMAYTSMEYQHHIAKIEAAETEMLLIQAKRDTEKTVIDCWRSLNASRRQGNIV